MPKLSLEERLALSRGPAAAPKDERPWWRKFLDAQEEYRKAHPVRSALAPLVEPPMAAVKFGADTLGSLAGLAEGTARAVPFVGGPPAALFGAARKGAEAVSEATMPQFLQGKTFTERAAADPFGELLRQGTTAVGELGTQAGVVGRLGRSGQVGYNLARETGGILGDLTDRGAEPVSALAAGGIAGAATGGLEQLESMIELAPTKAGSWKGVVGSLAAKAALGAVSENVQNVPGALAAMGTGVMTSREAFDSLRGMALETAVGGAGVGAVGGTIVGGKGGVGAAVSEQTGDFLDLFRREGRFGPAARRGPAKARDGAKKLHDIASEATEGVDGSEVISVLGGRAFDEILRPLSKDDRVAALKKTNELLVAAPMSHETFKAVVETVATARIARNKAAGALEPPAESRTIALVDNLDLMLAKRDDRDLVKGVAARLAGDRQAILEAQNSLNPTERAGAAVASILLNETDQLKVQFAAHLLHGVPQANLSEAMEKLPKGLMDGRNLFPEIYRAQHEPGFLRDIVSPEHPDHPRYQAWIQGRAQFLANEDAEKGADRSATALPPGSKMSRFQPSPVGPGATSHPLPSAAPRERVIQDNRAKAEAAKKYAAEKAMAVITQEELPADHPIWQAVKDADASGYADARAKALAEVGKGLLPGELPEIGKMFKADTSSLSASQLDLVGRYVRATPATRAVFESKKLLSPAAVELAKGIEQHVDSLIQDQAALDMAANVDKFVKASPKRQREMIERGLVNEKVPVAIEQIKQRAAAEAESLPQFAQEFVPMAPTPPGARGRLLPWLRRRAQGLFQGGQMAPIDDGPRPVRLPKANQVALSQDVFLVRSGLGGWEERVTGPPTAVHIAAAQTDYSALFLDPEAAAAVTYEDRLSGDPDGDLGWLIDSVAPESPGRLTENLFGASVDPRARAIDATIRGRALLVKLQAQRELRGALEEMEMLSPVGEGRNTVPVQLDVDPSGTKITHYTTPEMAEALQGVMNPQGEEKAWQAIKQLGRRVKVLQTAGSPSTQVRNMFDHWFQAVGFGLLPTKIVQAHVLGAQFRYQGLGREAPLPKRANKLGDKLKIAKIFGLVSAEEADAKVAKWHRLFGSGASREARMNARFTASPELESVQKIAPNSALGKLFGREAEATPTEPSGELLKKEGALPALGRIPQAWKWFYENNDNFARGAMFDAVEGQWLKALTKQFGGTMAADEIAVMAETKAAEEIRRQTPTWSQVPLIAHMMRRFPLFFAYPSFQFAWAQSAVSRYQDNYKGWREARAAGLYEISDMHAKRMVTATVAHAGLQVGVHAALAGIAKLLRPEEEEEVKGLIDDQGNFTRSGILDPDATNVLGGDATAEVMELLDNRFQRNSSVMAFMVKGTDWLVTVDWSQNNPAQGLFGDLSRAAGKGLVPLAKETADTFGGGPEPVISMGLDLITNRQRSGAPLFNPEQLREDARGSDFMETALNLATEIAEYTPYKQVGRLAKSMSETPNAGGRVRIPSIEALNMVSPFPVTVQDISMRFTESMYREFSRVRDIQNLGFRNLADPSKTPEEAAERVSNAEERWETEIYPDLLRKVKLAKKWMAPTTVYAVLQETAPSASLAKFLFAEVETPPPLLTARSLESRTEKRVKREMERPETGGFSLVKSLTGGR